MWNLKFGILSLLVITLATSTSAQHSRAKPKTDLGGGKIEITVPNIMRPARPRGSKQPEATETFFLLTRDEEGAWFYSTAGVEREGYIAKFAVAFVPNDLTAERQRLFSQHTGYSSRFLYLLYVGSLYGTQLDCGVGAYRFVSFADVTADRIITAEKTDYEWSEWRATNGTPWEAVRTKVCR